MAAAIIDEWTVMRPRYMILVSLQIRMTVGRAERGQGRQRKPARALPLLGFTHLTEYQGQRPGWL